MKNSGENKRRPRIFAVCDYPENDWTKNRTVLGEFTKKFLFIAAVKIFFIDQHNFDVNSCTAFQPLSLLDFLLRYQAIIFMSLNVKPPIR